MAQFSPFARLTPFASPVVAVGGLFLGPLALLPSRRRRRGVAPAGEVLHPEAAGGGAVGGGRPRGPAAVLGVFGGNEVFAKKKNQKVEKRYVLLLRKLTGVDAALVVNVAASADAPIYTVGGK